MRLERQLDSLARDAIQTALGQDAPALVRPASPEHGDFQVNGILPLAKQLKRPPRELAEAVAAQLRTAPNIERAEVAGPGFINLTLTAGWVAEQVGSMVADLERDGVPKADKLERVVIDYSGPNIAKQMHVGHLRSTIIGDSLYRLLRFVGHDVIGDNHVGDWGTQYGLLIVGMREYSSFEALGEQSIEELERVYKLASARSKQDPAFAEAARAELAKLQQGDPENRKIWERMVAATRVELDKVYTRFGIKFDAWLGESAYDPMLPGVVQELRERGIARESEGAWCVFPDGRPGFGKDPFIVQKKDGAFLYATTDLATLFYRRDHFHAQRAIYVVDARQALHFKQLFIVARELGIEMELQHISFGTVLGTDGKPLKTRDEAGVIRLAALLDEAEARATERLQKAREENLIELDDAAIAALAPVVGIGAVKYADLMQNRSSDYVFDWDKMISFKGNASPYLQYAYARIQATFRKGEIEPATLLSPSALPLEHPAELALGKELLRFADVVHRATEQSLPHLLCEHLYAVARAFSVFYEACHILRSEPHVRDARLRLAWLTGRQLKRGLGLLGIEAPERM